ncbi:MAG: ATP-binding protein [Verrucomicrobiota bacterium]
MSDSIKRRERDAILQSLQAGLVPKLGLHLIQVGRKAEVSAILADLDRISGAGSAFRVVVGRFGSGKSFFLNLVRTLALQKRLVVAQADFTMERRVQASQGEGRALWSELMRNLATKGKPEGGAVRNLVEGWISGLHHEVTQAGGTPDDVKKRIASDLKELQEHVGGFEFAQVLGIYYEAHLAGVEEKQAAALRWLRGEFSTKTEARELLGVRRIIDDDNFYDSLKLLAAFCQKAGYAGLLVGLDELVVLSHRLPSSRARQANYEAILTILNDCLQGSVSGLGFLLAGTDECLEDKRRGLFSYEALRTRLAENRFATNGIVDFSGPVIRLSSLAPEDLFVLLRNIRHVHAYGDPQKYLVPDDALVAVLKRANDTLGAEYFKTPRDIVRSFVGLLNVLEQNPNLKWIDCFGEDFLKKSEGAGSVEEEVARGMVSPESSDEDLVSFKL